MSESARTVVVATKPFDYRGDAVAVGEVCIVRPVDAAALIRSGQVRWPLSSEAFGVHQRPAPASSRRRYGRRDITAESA